MASAAPSTPHAGMSKGKNIKTNRSLLHYVDFSPTTVYFRGPYGKADQTVHAVVKSVSSKTIAFRIYTDKRQLYMTNPITGLLKPTQPTATIDLVMLASTKDNDLEPRTKLHHFIIQAMEWPEDYQEFKVDVWKELEDVAQIDIQRLIIDIEHDPPTKPPAESKKDLEPKKVSADSIPEVTAKASEDSFVTVSHTKLMFTGPYGKSQSQTLTVANPNPTKLVTAFKISSTKGEFYNVRPNMAVVQPLVSSNVEIELKEKFTQEEFMAMAPGTHKFKVHAIRWPARATSFDAKVWDQLVNEKKKPVQMLIIDVEMSLNK